MSAVSIKAVAAFCAARHGIHPDHLFGDCRVPRYVRPRHEAYWLARQMTGKTTVVIGEVLNRDNSTISYGSCKYAERTSPSDRDALIAECEAALGARRVPAELPAKSPVTDGEWRDLWREGLTSQEAADRTGRSRPAAIQAAQRLGFKWANRKAELMRERFKDPEFKARQMRGIIGSRPLEKLEGKTREDYAHLVYKKGYRSAEALEILGVAA